MNTKHLEEYIDLFVQDKKDLLNDKQEIQGLDQYQKYIDDHIQL